MNKCNKCGADISGTDLFCPKCGNKVVNELDKKAFQKLLTETRAANEICTKLSGMEETLNRLHDDVLSCKRRLNFAIVPSICLIGFTLMAGQGWFEAAKEILLKNGFFVFLISVVVYSLLLFGLIKLDIFMWKKYKKSEAGLKEQIKKTEEDAKKYEDDMNYFYASNYEKLLIMPQDYRYAMATSFILGLFENGRADSMKEAVNMYEDQLHKWKMESMNQKILNQQRQMNVRLASLEVATILNTFSRL